MDPLSDSREDPAQFDKYTSRERAVDCPQFMTLAFYIGRKYGVPKSGDVQKKLIYHYTDSAGLLGIVSSNRLWASEASFLNDPTEGVLFPDLVISSIRKKRGGLTALETQVVSHFEDGLKKYPKPPSAFAISFCDDGDLLSQWRGYGSSGSGYAIGFAADKFDIFQLGHFIEVQYEFDRVGDIALDLLSIFVDAAPKWGSLLNRFGEEAGQLMRYMSLSFKSPAYREDVKSEC
jgi:hypothetical protein